MSRHIPTILTTFTIASFAAIFAPAVALAYTIDDAGGDCATFGTWDGTTKTCTLDRDLTEGIEVLVSSVTIDGAGHAITGDGTGNGIYINGDSRPFQPTHLTVENITIRNFSEGVFMHRSAHTTVRNSTFEGNTIGVHAHQYFARGGVIENVIEDNTFTGNTQAIGMLYAHQSTVSGNTIEGGANGIILSHSDFSTIENNSVSGMQYFGIGISGMEGVVLRSNHVDTVSEGSGLDIGRIASSTISGNTVTRAHYGVNLSDFGALTFTDNTLESSVVSGALFFYSGEYPGVNTLERNTIDGKPIIYREGATGETFDESDDPAAFYCIHCSDVTLRGVALDHTSSPGAFSLTRRASRWMECRSQKGITQAWALPPPQASC